MSANPFTMFEPRRGLKALRLRQAELRMRSARLRAYAGQLDADADLIEGEIDGAPCGCGEIDREQALRQLAQHVYAIKELRKELGL